MVLLIGFTQVDHAVHERQGEKISVREKIKPNSKRSIPKMAIDHGVAYRTMYSLVTKDLEYLYYCI